MSRDLEILDEKHKGRSRKSQLIAFILALIVVVLCTAVVLAQQNSGEPDNVIMAGHSDFPLHIPDDGSWLRLGSVDKLAPRNGTVKSVNLKLLIDHPNPNQLQMQLVKDGFSAVYPLAQTAALAMEGGAIGMMNIGVFAGAPAEGPWILSIRDQSPGGQGYLNGMSVIARYTSDSNQRDPSSISPGTPTSFSLPGGARTVTGGSQKTAGTDDPPETHTPQSPTSWQTIRFNGFGNFPYPDWTIWDQSPAGDWLWDDTTCKPHTGSWSAWPAAGGADALTPCVDNYANDMDSWMVYGPFDLSDAYDARTRWYMWRELEACCDSIYFGWSDDGFNFIGEFWYGNATEWVFHQKYYADMTGLSEVWVAWVFQSDGSVTYDGAFIDNIYIEKNVLGTPSLSAIANGDGNGNYTLSWSSAEGAESYEVQEQRGGGGWSSIDSVTGTSQGISGRSGGEACYRVRARTDRGSAGAYSNIQCTWVIPTVPTINTISNSDKNGSYSVSWSSETGASSYSLQERHNGGSWGTIYSGSSTSRSITGNSSGEWCYQVRASNPGGNSAWSIIECTEVANPVIHLSVMFSGFANYFEGPMEQEDNDGAESANGPLRFSTTYRGHPDDQRDFFSFYLPNDGQFTIQLANHKGQGTQLQLFYQYATVGNRITYDAEAPYMISHNGQKGIYYIFIYSTGNYSSASEYTLKVTRP